MPAVAIFACPNGLGHIKRVLAVLHCLHSQFNHPLAHMTLFTDEEKLQSFEEDYRFLKEQGLRFEHVAAGNHNGDLENYYIEHYGSQSLRTYDRIWSDNLTFPLKYHQTVCLSGSFLWHEVLEPAAHGAFIREEKALLKRFRPPMIGVRHFATPAVTGLTRFTGVGLYNYRFPPADNSPVEDKTAAKSTDKNPNKTGDKTTAKTGKDAILIACGKSPGGRARFRKLAAPLRKMISHLVKQFKIYIEPDFHPLFNIHPNVQPAPFTVLMFSRLLAAVIRPGMGTICPVLAHGGKIFTLPDPDPEMIHNTKVLQQLQVGQEGNIPLLAQEITTYATDAPGQQRHREKLSQLTFDGVFKTAQYLNQYLSNA